MFEQLSLSLSLFALTRLQQWHVTPRLPRLALVFCSASARRESFASLDPRRTVKS